MLLLCRSGPSAPKISASKIAAAEAEALAIGHKPDCPCCSENPKLRVELILA